MNTITTREQLARWFSEHCWFEDGHVLSLSPAPDSAASLPLHVVLRLAYQIEGDYKAHSRSVSRVFELTLDEVTEYSFPKDGVVSPEHCVAGVQLVEDATSIGFSVDMPSPLIVVFRSARVRELPNLVETVAPRLSNSEIWARVQGRGMPAPREWVEMFSNKGQEVAWHMYGGEPRSPEEVPASEYAGWYLQDPALLDRARQGIFFFACRTDGQGFILRIRNQGATDALWQAAELILGEFEEAEIHCGNCEFSGPEWLSMLNKRKGVTGITR